MMKMLMAAMLILITMYNTAFAYDYYIYEHDSTMYEVRAYDSSSDVDIFYINISEFDVWANSIRESGSTIVFN